MKQRIVLAYSGGLDTSVCIKWLEEKYGYDVITLGLEVGESRDHGQLEEKALQIGAVKAVTIDAKEVFARDYILPALKANALYEGKYPISSALSRPLIAQFLVETAHREGAVAVAHGCTGKGNDQVRFEVSIQALDPSIKVVAPVREWKMNRDQEIAYAQERGIPIPVDLDKPYSIDANIWGRACEAGVLEDPWLEAPEDAFAWTNPIASTPHDPEDVEISFHQGVPVAINGQKLGLVQIILHLNQLGGRHGVGRIDHIENRLVGIKSREVYECPAALILINAHRELEFLTLPRETSWFKAQVDQLFAKTVYEGLWCSPLKKALDAFILETQKTVSGTVRVKLHKGNHTVTGRSSDYSLYNMDLATYAAGDMFDHDAAAGFIKLWGLPTKLCAEIQQKGGGDGGQ